VNKTDLLARIDGLIAQGAAVIASITGPPARPHPQLPYVENHQWVDLGLAAAYRTAGLSLLNGMYGENGQPAKDFNQFTDDKRTVVNFKQAHGVVQAVRAEVDNDWFYNTRALVAADVFSDILEMAQYLIEEGYKDAAAVLTGSSLEAHLKSLCLSNTLDTHFLDGKGNKVPKKADTINADLYKAGTYSNNDQKNVTAWLGLRNDAAHGDYGKYTIDQVRIMWDGVKDFLKRVPA
jgi:hypothetical protein